MSTQENQCNEIHCDKSRINGFASTVEGINGHLDDRVRGQEVMGSGDNQSASKWLKFQV